MYTKKIYFSGGSFHELQEVFSNVRGVQAVRTGYINAAGDASYKAVVAGRQQAVLGIEVCYDPKKTDVSTLMDILFAVINPYTLDKQGSCEGPMYRSGVYYIDAEDEPIVELHMNFIASRGKPPAATGAALTMNDPNSDRRLARKCYAQSMPLQHFQPAGEEHQHYLRKHPDGHTFIDFFRLRELHIIS